MQDFNKVVRNDDSGLAVRVWGVEKKSFIRALGVFPGVLIGKVGFYITVSGLDQKVGLMERGFNYLLKKVG